MLCETIYLREAEGDKSVYMNTYVCRREGDMTNPDPRPAILILPGGAYFFLAEREAEPIAKAYLAEGFNAFVLYYSLAENAKFPRPVQDVSLALAYIRRHAEEWNINPDEVYVTGSSAGGHLAGSIGTFWNRDWAAFDGMEKGENKPTAVVLSYPATSMLEYGHDACRHYVCGEADKDKEEVRRAYSLECQVTEDTVPHFIWQTATDDCVDVQNSIILASALAKAKVPVELHIFPKGPHGMSVCTKEIESGNPATVNPHVGHWVKLSVEFMEQIKK